MKVDLSKYKNPHYQPGPIWKRATWHVINALFIHSFLPFSSLKIALLKIYGAKIGSGCTIKPGVNIKHPWMLSIGDYSWIGENVWIDNIAPVTIGSHCCISQGVTLIVGNHRYDKAYFDLTLHPIALEDGVWVGAKSTILPGCKINEQSVITAGSIVKGNIPAEEIWGGNPAVFLKKRIID
jgi:putative colanic acid biosynthesis acetyltransferase WcaF